MHVGDPESLDKAAIEDNEATTDALPMTFVDYAELVWKRSEDGQTQQQIADALKWSRSAVADYCSLSKIDKDAWALVAMATTKKFKKWRHSQNAYSATSWTWIPPNKPDSANDYPEAKTRRVDLTARQLWLSVYRVMGGDAPENGGTTLDLHGDLVIAGEVDGVDIGIVVTLELFEDQTWRARFGEKVS